MQIVMRKIFFALAISTLFFSCLPKEKEVKIDKFSEKLVVNSRVIPNSVMLVSLTRSFSILSDGYSHNEGENGAINNDLMSKILVSDAVVTVSYHNQVDTLYMLAPGMYASITTPQITNEEYTLNVIDKEHGLQVKAVEKMPSQIKFTYTNFVYENGVLKFKYKFNDPSEINYYAVNIVRQNSSNMNPANADITTFLSNGANVIGTFPISDLNFNGTAVDAEISLSEYTPVSQQDTVVVSLSNISEGYYNYLNLRKKVNNNLMSLIFNEPINYPTNVEKGLGYFSTHFPDSKVLILPLKQ